jgi:nucleoside 2-deoxyribosyltransferase
MKTFIAYRSSDEDPQVVEPLMIAIRDAFKARGVEAYCTFFDEAMLKDKSLNARQIMEHAFGIIDDSDFLFVVQTSNNKSEGMLMEVGYCLAKNIPIIVATKDAVTQTYVPSMASQSFNWGTIEDLVISISIMQY